MKRIVFKIGTALLSNAHDMALDRIDMLCAFFSELLAHYEVIIVSSGAIATGHCACPLPKTTLANRQALAAIGQPLLLALYRQAFAKYGATSAQILLSAHNFDSRKQTENAKNMVEVLLQNKILPIINENDAVATAEIVFGDNDRLAAHVAHYFDCDLLIILSDIEGYYTKDPHKHKDATLRKVVQNLSESELDASATPHTEFSTGGIVTKLQAAHFLMQHGKQMFLCNGFDLSAARDFLLRKTHTRGTLFCKESP